MLAGDSGFIGLVAPLDLFLSSSDVFVVGYPKEKRDDESGNPL